MHEKNPNIDLQEVTLNLVEAANFLHISASALREKTKAGKIPGAKIGKRWIYIESDLAAYIRSRYASPRQALRVATMENSLCHSINEKPLGGSDLRPQTEREYDALLKRTAK